MTSLRCKTWPLIFHRKVQQNDKGHVTHRRWAIDDPRFLTLLDQVNSEFTTKLEFTSVIFKGQVTLDF